MGALDGIRVVEIGHWIAAPLAGLLLSDQGAKVVQVRRPDAAQPPRCADAALSRGKIQIRRDLKTSAGRSEILRLIDESDVLIENFRPGVADRLGLGWETIKSRNPGIIYCSLPGFGAGDPRAPTPAWEGVIGAATGAYPSRGDNAASPVFTALPIASAYAAIAAAVAITMALIARERLGAGQRIEVPLFDATFMAIGAGGLLVNGMPAGGRPDDPWGGVFRCLDGGSIRLSLATPVFVRRFVEAAGRRDWIERGYLDPGLLRRGTDLRREQEPALRDLFLSRVAGEWEALGAEADVPLTRLRSIGEWMQSEQAVASETVVTVQDPDYGSMMQPGVAVRLSKTPGEVRSRRAAPVSPSAGGPAPPAGQPPVGSAPALDGVRVLDLTQVLAGPTAGRTLAEYGADVIKINNPHEEGAGYRWSVHRYHTDVNRGKRSILLDLKTSAGQEILGRLLNQSDVLLQKFRPAAAKRLGVDYDSIRTRYPRIVHGTVSMYGSSGPWAELPGYEVNAQAVSGMTARMGGMGQPFAVNDYATGLLAAFGVGLALFHRLKTGVSQSVEAALARTATVLQSAYAQVYDGKVWDEPAGPETLGWSSIQRLYRASDGWFFLGMSDAQLPNLGRLTGLAGIDTTGEAEVTRQLEERFVAEPVDTWVDRLTHAGAGAHRLASLTDLMLDPNVAGRGLSLTREHAGGESITTVAPPARLSLTPVTAGAPASPPGADAPAILAEIGMAVRLAELVEQGAIALS